MRAVLLGRPLRPLAREAVAGVGLHDLQLEAGGGDVRQVELSLAGPGDAGRPELGLAGGASRDLPLGDDVGERQPAAGAEHARDLGEHAALVGREVHDAVRDHDVERAGVERQLLDPRATEADVLVAHEALGFGAAARA